MRNPLAIVATVALVAGGLLFAHQGSGAAAGLPQALATVTAASTATPLPSQMTTTGAGCKQLIVVTVDKLGDTTGTLQVFDLVRGSWEATFTCRARLGKRGVIDGVKRKAGDNATPTGIWAMPDYVFGTHTHAPTGGRMKFRRLDSRSWWSSKRGSTYNKWVEARHWTGEYIAGSPKAYEFAVSTGYNAHPNTSVFGRGTGIFLHVSHPGLTAGCVEIARSNIIRVFRLLDRAKHPHFAIGTLRAGSSTSIWAY